MDAVCQQSHGLRAVQRIIAAPGSCGDRIRTCDLRVMSPASYRTATTPLEPTIGHDPMTYALREHRSTN